MYQIKTVQIVAVIGRIQTQVYSRKAKAINSARENKSGFAGIEKYMAVQYQNHKSKDADVIFG